MDAVLRNHGLARDWTVKGERRVSDRCRQPGLVWKEVFPWIILLSHPPQETQQYCDFDCCITAIPCVRARVRCLNIQLPAHVRTRLSISAYRDSGIQKRTPFVGAGW
jgi:hypothetical protein